ncbi:DUF503 domain-containing protein [Clostridium formicaceticum]|uniref:DUF503 domain-containing protein n=1 Tax=Clostridium formicaceticum TaxID=1497 RepID=A0AAC9RIL2_9CLOT|nr:DUF503 domain-containing protein [Clostridium formicaceticum]AOY76336.1 hypothetical protein BJL90_10730 [Clostridium formicaceticum]ARE86726.1 hypothetical protein CLFO_10530 [Clostridium formicaceticum]
MLVGVCSIKVFMYGVSSLKGKRQIIKSIIERVKGKFNVSIAEVGDQDKWQIAEIGFCCITNSRKHADAMLNNVIHFIEMDGRLDITECQVEIL